MLEYTHWFRAKLFQQYRLFFRYNKDARIIIYGWVNDEKTKRAYDIDILPRLKDGGF